MFNKNRLVFNDKHIYPTLHLKLVNNKLENHDWV